MLVYGGSMTSTAPCMSHTTSLPALSSTIPLNSAFGGNAMGNCVALHPPRPPAIRRSQLVAQAIVADENVAALVDGYALRIGERRCIARGDDGIRVALELRHEAVSVAGNVDVMHVAQHLRRNVTDLSGSAEAIGIRENRRGVIRPVLPDVCAVPEPEIGDVQVFLIAPVALWLLADSRAEGSVGAHVKSLKSLTLGVFTCWSFTNRLSCQYTTWTGVGVSPGAAGWTVDRAAGGIEFPVCSCWPAHAINEAAATATLACTR